MPLTIGTRIWLGSNLVIQAGKSSLFRTKAMPSETGNRQATETPSVSMSATASAVLANNMQLHR